MKKMTALARMKLKMLQLFIPDGPDGDFKRGQLYRPFLRGCGKNFKVATGVFIFNPNLLTAGDDVYIGFSSYVGQGEVLLESEVLIGNHVSITATNHVSKDGSFRFGGYQGKAIKIGRGSWIGAHACVLAGVEIGPGCVVAAGSVVTKSFAEDEGVLLAGIPASVKKKL